jgi:hypothetical protein
MRAVVVAVTSVIVSAFLSVPAVMHADPRQEDPGPDAG